MESKLILSLSMLALSACTSREKISLSHPGNGATITTNELSAAISDAGMSPNCREGRFCKFKVGGQGTVHYKLAKREPVVVVEIPESVEEGERARLEQEMTKLAKEIWGKASKGILDKAEAEKQAKAEQRRLEQEAALERERLASAERIEREKLYVESEKDAAKKAAADEAAKKVTESIAFEGKSDYGAAIKVENPEGAMCTSTSDNSGRSKSLEVPFQIEATPGAYYTVECTLPSGSSWRKKVQTREHFVTVVRLRQGAR